MASILNFFKPGRETRSGDPVGRPGRETRSGDFVGTPPQVRNISGGGARDRQCLRFRTFGNPELKFYYDLFYPAHSYKGRKKRVAKNFH